MNILIVEDYPLVCEVLESVAREAFEALSIDTAGCCAEAVEKAWAAEALDMVLLDLELPDCEGMETLKRVRHAHSTARIIVLSDTEDPSCAVAAMEGGAQGFLTKRVTRPMISAALRLVAGGGTYVASLPMPIRDLALNDASRRRSDLTARQLDVLQWIAKGLTNKQIGERLRIAEDTVKQHARGAYAALGVSSRTQAMRAAALQGIRFE